MKSGKHVITLILVLLFASGLAACQKKAVVQPETTQPTQPQTLEKKEAEKVTEKKIDSSVESVDVKDKGAQYVESKESMFADILFDYDKYAVADKYKSVLQSVSAWMTKNPSSRLSIEGHCDDRGTNEYNLALGDRRAKAVKDYLMSLGVSSERIDVISYGEERPVCTEQSEECWAKNRRAHFVILTKVGK